MSDGCGYVFWGGGRCIAGPDDPIHHDNFGVAGIGAPAHRYKERPMTDRNDVTHFVGDDCPGDHRSEHPMSDPTPITPAIAETMGTFSEHRKLATTRISDFTVPPGVPYQTPEGLRAEDEPTRIAFDVQGGVYPIRESVFLASYAALSTTPSPLDAAWAAAEAALPEEWRPRITFQRGSTERPLEPTWHATAEDVDDERAGVIGTGPTPAAALLALAEKLREAKP